MPVAAVARNISARACRILLATTSDANEIMQPGFKKRVDDVAFNMWLDDDMAFNMWLDDDVACGMWWGPA